MNQEEQQLVNKLCETLFSSHSNEHRKQAQQQLEPLARIDNIPKLQCVMENSNENYSQFWVAQTLIRIVTDHWNSLSEENKIQLRSWLINVIGTRGLQMQGAPLKQVILLLCRLTKLGWLDHPAHQDLPKDVHNFFLKSSNNNHISIGLMILNGLIQEINQVAPKRTLTQHRKTSVSFREGCLFDIFKTSLMTLEGIRRDAQSYDSNICEQGLQLALSCLSFDFVGIFPDDSSDDIGTVQIPNSWRNVMIDYNTMQLFWDLYAALPSPRSTECLKCIVQFASVRRSLFSTDEERRQWLSRILGGILSILKQKQGLDVSENYQEFCRLLSRIKPNYQLSELVNADSYSEWIELSAAFTVESFINWRVTNSSHFFLLALWSRLVTSQPYLKGEKPSRLDTYVPQVASEYIKSRLELAQAAVQQPHQVENVLEDQDNLVSQLESVPVLVRSCYAKMGPFILSLFTPILNEFTQGCALNQVDEGANKNFQILEGQLAWLVYVMGSVIGHHVIGTPSPDAEVMDADLTANVFNLRNAMDRRQQMQGALASQSLQRLESAVLHFCHNFRKVYIGEAVTPCSRIYPRLNELTGLEDHMAVLNLIVGKTVQNLKVWRGCERLISETLNLFCDLSAGYSTGRFLLKLEGIRRLLESHNSAEFPFLDDFANSKYRSKFYRTITNLLWMETVAESSFELYMKPFKQIFLQLETLQSPEMFRQPMVKTALVGLLRDLRGICFSCVNKRTYTLFFEWIFPQHMDVLGRVCQVFGPDPSVSIPLLKFFADFVQNRSQRIMFDSSSPNGILLFKEASMLLQVYGNAVLSSNNPHPSDSHMYEERYKGFYVCMNMLTRTLSGNYCNFGAMSHYKDDALDRALEVVIKMALSIPLPDLMAYQKVSAAYYSLMEELFNNHCQQLATFDTSHFLQMVRSLEEAIKAVSLNRTIVLAATQAISHLTTFYFTQTQKNTQYASMLAAHFQQDAEIFPRILNSIFNVVLFEECPNQWSLSRPMLPLILMNEKFFQEYKQQVVSSVPADKQPRLMEAFEKLMVGIERNLENPNRDKFTTNLTTFRQQTKVLL